MGKENVIVESLKKGHRVAVSIIKAKEELTGKT